MTVFISMNHFGHAILESLLERGVPIARMYSLHPKKAVGISDYHNFSAIARQHRIPLRYVTHIHEAKDELRKLKPAHLIVCGWSQILDAEILAIPAHGVIGSHPAILPKNRGRAAIPWHIILKEKKGGITFFYMDEGCDSGPIIAQRTFTITQTTTASDYYTRIITDGCAIVREIAPALIQGRKLPARAQNHRRATYLAKRTFEDGMINWQCDAASIERLVRALTPPYPGAWTVHRESILYIDEAVAVGHLPYTGLSGQVVSTSESGMVVQTGKGFLRITKFRGETKPRTGDTLGVTVASLWLKKS